MFKEMEKRMDEEMNMDVQEENGRQDQVQALFESGYNCAQSVFAAYCDLFGISRETGLKLSCSLGGGYARMREMCGAVSGMALICGLACGNTDPSDQTAKTENYTKMREMIERFREENGSYLCRELLGVESAEASASPSPRTKEYYASRPCSQLVRSAGRIIEETFPEYFV